MARVRNKFHLVPHFEDGSWWGEVEELPGCFATGDDFGELLESLSESIAVYLDGRDGRIEMIDPVPAEPAESELAFEFA